MFLYGLILLSDVKEVGSNVPFLILIVFILMLPLFFVLVRKGGGNAKKKGRKRSIREKLTTPKIRIELEAERRLRPRNFRLTIKNTGNIEVDLNAPVVVFKRWRSVRKFRINPAGKRDVYPTWLEPGDSYVLNINLEEFYQSEPELRRACRIRVEVKDVNGKKFKSDFVRIKWL